MKCQIFNHNVPTMKNISHFILFLDQSQNLGMNNDEEWRPRRRGSQL